MTRRLITDAERRSRLARRHGVAPDHRYLDAATATEAMTVLHATEAATVHLSLWARVGSVTLDEVDSALYKDRTLVKQLAMRRTLFVFPRDLLAAAWGSASARVATQQRNALIKEVAGAGIADDAATWVEDACAAVVNRLADGVFRSSSQLREEVPELAGRVHYAPGKKWGGEVPIAPRVLTLLGAEGAIVRATNGGHWRLNRPTWTTTKVWLGETPAALTVDEGYAELVRRWLWTFGPGTETDVVWWLGATKTATRRALADVGAVDVDLEDGSIGWVLPDDVDPVEEVDPWPALLPTLDPTVMGWKERGFYLDPGDARYLFDSSGNAGNTAWWDGRIVGSWVQDTDGVVKVVTRDSLGSEARAALDAEAARLTSWLDGLKISSVYSSEAMNSAKLP